MKTQSKFLLIGWDAADWKVVNPLLDAGKMPNLQKLVEGGIVGNLSTLKPTYSPMLWTSIATGKRSFKHGINGFYEPAPLGDSVRPISSYSRTTRAFWNMMTLANRRSIITGWWPSHPAEPINGIMVSNLYQRAEHNFGDPWPEKEGLIHPVEFKEKLEDLRIHPQELDPGLIQLFIPNLKDINQRKDRHVQSVAKITADITNLNMATEALLKSQDWDVAAMYLDGIDHYCHGFMCFHPPQMKGVDDYLYKNYNYVIEAGYRYHDFLLGKLMNVIPEETYVMIVSDHGFHSDHLRPNHIPNEPAGPAVEHRDVGFFAFKGPGVKKDERIYGASLLDVTPTILYSMDLPTGLDMDGKPLVNAFENPKPISTIPSWDDIEGYDGSHPEELRLNTQESNESLKQLVELGYIDAQDKDMAKNVANAKRELDFNLAQSYLDAYRYLDALKILNQLLEEHPEELRYYLMKTKALIGIQKNDKAEACLQELFDQKKANVSEARKQMMKIRKEHGDDVNKYNYKIRKHYDELDSVSRWNHTSGKLMMATVCQNQKKYDKSLKYFQAAAKGFKDNPAFLCTWAKGFNQAGFPRKAMIRYNKALKLDPENIAAFVGKAQVYLETGRYEDCMSTALEAIGLQFELPKAHYLLGESLRRLKDFENAEKAFQVSVLQAPYFIVAHEGLVDIYLHHIKNNVKLRHHQDCIEKAIEHEQTIRENSVESVLEMHEKAGRAMSSDQIKAKNEAQKRLEHTYLQNESSLSKIELSEQMVIVSGLPRSGTSMLMQMLEAGGVPSLTDGKRKADESNPKGYYELEAIKSMRKNNDFLDGASGHCLKIIAQQLVFLPKKYEKHYRIIMIHRDMQEIMQSQGKMLKKDEKRSSSLSDDQLAQNFRKQQFLCEQFIEKTKIPALHIPYHLCIEKPDEMSQEIQKFLGIEMNQKAMSESVSPELYRNKKLN